jgi:hypothetical protein
VNESEVPVLGAVEVSYEHNDPCEACRGFERHNADRCSKPGTFEVSGVKLCSYHNAVRGYVPVLYLADGRGMNHAGVVGDPPSRVTEPAAGVVDALVALAERMTGEATAGLVGAPIGYVVAEPPPAGGMFDVIVYDEATDLSDIIKAIDRVLPTSIPPSEAEPAPRMCTPPPREPVPVPPFMSTDSATRKGMPVATGFVEYFPDAMLIASMVSLVGAIKHCGGKLGWDKSKSGDEPDAELRHMIDRFRGDPADPGLEALAHLGHYASKLWRAAADAQRACDAVRAAFNRGEDWRK